MKYKIGFTEDKPHNEKTSRERRTGADIEPVKSVIRVHFPQRNLTCSYYNDTFDLHKGDIVYVEGKLEGMQGVVVDVSHVFKIKVSDYKRVIGVADTEIYGELFPAGSHLVAKQRDTIPFEKILSWFSPPKDEEEYETGDGEIIVDIDDPESLKISSKTAEKGFDYYRCNRVVYTEVSDGRGRAIVQGSECYTLEFEYADRHIRNITCSCYCSGVCKHIFAAVLQLRDILNFIGDLYCGEDFGDYFAAVSKEAFFEFALSRSTGGKITIE